MSVQAGSAETQIFFKGRLDSASLAPLWLKAMATVRALRRDQRLVIDLGDVSRCDIAGATFVLAAEAAHGGAEIRGGSDAVRAVIARVRQARIERRPAEQARPPTLMEIVSGGVQAALGGIAFIGEAVVAIVRLPRHRRMLRIVDFMRYTDDAGVRSLPLVLLMGALTGLIMSFQFAVAMRRFASDIFVVNGVTVAVLRELGPLLAAVILAGRTASADAAEIGTMKINEEISALVVMGIDPMTMLVLPRMAAALVAMPGMALAFEIAAMFGMLIVMMGFGYTPQQIYVQARDYAQLKDLFGGMLKAAVFGVAIAATGCRAGLSTGHGPRAVGHSATTAVVGGIVATILIDGIFAAAFYATGY